MSGAAPYVGKRVAVCGTSRDDLNGSKGVATDYDRDKGRYNVSLDNGQVVALKPANLEPTQDPGPAKPTAPKFSWPKTAPSTPKSDPASATSWPMMVMMGLFAIYVCSQFAGSGGGSGSSSSSLFSGDGDDAEYHDRDEGFLSGKVREVTTLDELRGALAHHSHNTGLPVVVDFYSHSCGPCRMIAPLYKRLASEFKGRAVFLKVDVNRNYEASSACGVRGMPTFQFFQNTKKVYQFSGADDRSLRHYTSDVVDKAEEAGTYVGQEVTGAALRKFYDENDAKKAEESPKLAEKYAQKTAQLMRVCKAKYSKIPEVSPRGVDSNTSSTDRRQVSARKGTVFSELTLEELNAESQQLQAEFQRRGAEYRKPAEQREEDDDAESFFMPAANASAEGVHKVVIIGGGPAGLSAAVYAARAGLKPLVLAPSFGGQLLGKGVDVENYPGVVGEHATGRGIVELMRQQAASFEARFVDAAVLGINLKERPFRIHVNGTTDINGTNAATEEILAHAVILACGAESRWLNVSGEHEFRGRGVSACATCDGFLFRDKEVAVVGGGDTAMEDALHLGRTSARVTLIHRRDRLRASKVLADRVLAHKSIHINWNATVESFHGGDDLSHIMFRSEGSKSQRLKTSAVFVAIGHDPQTPFLQGQVELDAAGYVVLQRGTSTSVPGVFAAGDIADHTYRQAVTASGTGAMAALDAERYLNQLM